LVRAARNMVDIIRPIIIISNGGGWGMALFINKFENIFKNKNLNLNDKDLREYVLGKIFPTIRYGRDADLERYISLREGGKDSAEWKGFYENLSHKYTEPERKQLIRSMRKNLRYFNHVFSKIINDLYKRVITMIKHRIDLLVKELHGIEHISKSRLNKDHNMLARVEAIIALCSQNKTEAADGIRFLAELSQNLGYKQKDIRKIQHLVKSYFDGSLFEEAEAKLEYHFDIREEYKKQKKPAARPAGDEIKLKIFITEEDIDRILVERDRHNEYELSFSYFEQYIKYIDDPEFATKVYVYSKKHNTPHYQIFESIRKGVTYNYQKNRVFDDIFKIICQGRYVFNITNEKQMDKKLRTIGKPSKKAASGSYLPPGRGREPAPYVPPGSDRTITPYVPPGRGRTITPYVPPGRDRTITPYVPPGRELPSTPYVPPGLDRTVTPYTPPGRDRLPAAPPDRTGGSADKQLRPDRTGGSAGRQLRPDRTGGSGHGQAPGRAHTRRRKPKKSGRETGLTRLNRPRSTHSIEEMAADLSADKRIRHLLLTEFRSRLPGDLTKALGFQNSGALDDEHKIGQLKDLIHYVMHNYDSILCEEHMFKPHKDRIEGMGFSLHAIYTVILNSFNGVKSEFLTGELSQKVHKSLSRRFKFF
jgi:hypothetical protein